MSAELQFFLAIVAVVVAILVVFVAIFKTSWRVAEPDEALIISGLRASAARARNRSVPWRTSMITSPRCPGVMSAVTLASFPTTSSATFPSSAIGAQAASS